MLSVVGCLVLLCLLLVWLLLPGKTDPDTAAPFLERNYAHRGLHDGKTSIPENSLAAFDRAASKDYGIELDVRLTKDDRVVVFHDDTLTRMCGIDKAVIDCTYAELQTYRLADSEERIPLFSDVLACVGGRVPLIVELKQGKKTNKLCSLTYELLQNYAGLYCIESFDPRIVMWFRKNAPDIMRGQLSCKLKSTDIQPWILRFLLINLFLNVIARPHFIAYAADDMSNPFYRFVTGVLGAIPVGWTIRDEKMYRKQIKAGTKMLIFENFEPKTRF